VLARIGHYIRVELELEIFDVVGHVLSFEALDIV